MNPLLHMRPELAQLDLADVKLRQTELPCDLSVAHTRCQHATDPSDLRFGQRGVSVGLTPRFVHQPERAGSSVIFGARDVLQLRGAVVRLDPFGVVDLPTSRSTVEGTRYENVDSMRLAHPTFAQVDSWIPLTDRGRFQDVPACERRTATCSTINSFDATSPHSTEAADFIESLVPDNRFPLFTHDAYTAMRRAG